MDKLWIWYLVRNIFYIYFVTPANRSHSLLLFWRFQRSTLESRARQSFCECSADCARLRSAVRTSAPRRSSAAARSSRWLSKTTRPGFEKRFRRSPVHLLSWRCRRERRSRAWSESTSAAAGRKSVRRNRRRPAAPGKLRSVENCPLAILGQNVRGMLCKCRNYWDLQKFSSFEPGAWFLDVGQKKYSVNFGL